MLTCASCGRENPAGARFCNACAAPLAADAPAQREERKVVTVLFADLVGFTARAERMDPEEVRRLLQPYHARLRSVLEHHGGTVEKFIGDAVMALFGAPVAHEDDPERALRAALAIRDALADDGDLEVRIGITTGEALVALGARPEAGEGVASGDVVNTASRLQAAAPVGGILVDEMTYRATERAVEYRDEAPVLAKGKAEPVRVWQVLRARSGTDLERPSGATLVGRTQELTLLLDTLARVKREREPQLITLVGVPGIGKSRLVFELFEELERRSELVYWRHGRSPPYGEGVTFWALGEMVKAHAGILESDRPEQAEEKLRGAVAAAISERAEAAWVGRHLRPLAGIETEDFGTGDRRSEAFAAWRRFLEALAEERPLVLVFEDLHWADDALLDFIDHLVDWASGVPMFVVATTRPELLARRPGWGGGRVNSATTLLAPLSDGETAALVRALLVRSELPAQAEAELLERAGGNPLYAEEFARMLTDRPAELALPESVHGLIAARLDALPREEKDLLQDAAVLGKVFWLGALGGERWRLEESLHSLARKEFVRRERRSSVAGEAEYTFRHALIREVAYEQIPKSQRAAKHRSTAEWIESLGRREDHAEMLAHHYVQALEYAGESDEGRDQVAERAVGALQGAGDRALALNAYPAAARLYETALEALDLADASDEEMRCELLLALGEAEGRAGNTAAANEVLLDAVGIARRLGLSRELARAANNYGGRMVWARGSLDARLVPLLEEGLAGLSQEDVELRARLLARLAGALRDEHTRDRRDALSREAVELARRTGNPAALAGALDGRAFAILAPDTVAECIALGSELRDVAERIGDRERVVDGYMERVAALATTGEISEAEADVAAALPLAEQLGQPAYVWDAGAAQAMLALAAGRLSEGEELAERFFGLGRPAVGASAIAVYQVHRYTLCDFRGRVEEVEPAIRDLIATQPTRPIFRCVLAHLHARLGRLPEAEQALRELAEDDFAIVPFDQEWLFCMSLLAETSALVGDGERASVLYGLLLPWAQLNVADMGEGIRGSVSRYLGLLAATMKRWEEAERHFEDAVAMNARMGARPWLAHAQSDYAQMLLGRDGPGDRERAQELLGAAIATYRDLGMESYAAKARALTQDGRISADRLLVRRRRGSAG
jgi:class 3 adenylate cyclase/tetratricopeptide (TPR) repeat protein